MQDFNVKTDMRVYRSKRDLAKALEELLEAKNFDDISVSEIVKKAMVSKNTFYNNFLDKNDLLNYLLHIHANNVLVKIEPLREAKLSKEEFFIRAIKEIVHSFYQSPLRFYNMMKNDNSKSLYWSINSFIESLVRYTFSNSEYFTNKDKLSLDLLCPFLSGGMTNLMYSFANKNEIIGEKELVEDILKLIKN